MVDYILKILTITSLCVVNPLQAQEIWQEEFSTPDRGIWGCEEGSVCSDFSGVDGWFLAYTDIDLSNSGDYAKTVTTSGGRFEVCDIDGEIIWMSEIIDISDCKEVKIELTASETGSGNNQETKYLKTCYCLDDGPVVPFHENSENRGNWGSVVSQVNGLSGDSLRIICYLSTHYSSDKVILDHVFVINDIGPLPPANPMDVVINELMADPTPSVGLPDVEYVELYNTRETAVLMEGWGLKINGVTKKIPRFLLNPDSYLLLCASGSKDELLPFGDVCHVVGFQGLLNRGATVGLMDGSGIVIDSVAYNDSWYGDPVKASGGWSLERIDPLRNCHAMDNWKASSSPVGGTPGALNTLRRSNPDLIPPSLVWGVAVSNVSIELKFSEPMDLLHFDVENFLVREIGYPQSIELKSSECIQLCFSGDFSEDRMYELQIYNQSDECGNALSASLVQVQWNKIRSGDLVINEVLFDPFQGGEDFVELYNRSEKMVDVSRIRIANRNNEGEIIRICPLTDERITMGPGAYLAVTKDTLGVFPWYYIPATALFLQMNSFPSYPNGEGVVLLLNETEDVVDEFFYSDQMHSPFIADAEGFSLERVSPFAGTNEPGNWQSASSLAGGGTPGYQNSQNFDGAASDPVVSFEPQRFSPVNSGIDHLYHVNYQNLDPGYMARIMIFDSDGNFMHHLINGEISGTRGSISWNGKDETGRLLPSGIYIVLVEFYNGSGQVHRFKDGIILSCD